MDNIEKVRLLDLPKILDKRGNLTFLENNNQIPFDIKRVYWIYDVPGGEYRGGHAFKETDEIIIALSGSFDVVINDGKNEKRISLRRSYQGVLIPKILWRSLDNFSTNALALVISSTKYNETDYIRSFSDFKMMQP